MHDFPLLLKPLRDRRAEACRPYLTMKAAYQPLQKFVL